MSDWTYEEAAGDAFERFKAAVAAAYELISQTLAPVWAEMERVYQEAGAPYGTEPDDAVRWWREQSETQRIADAGREGRAVSDEAPTMEEIRDAAQAGMVRRIFMRPGVNAVRVKKGRRSFLTRVTDELLEEWGIDVEAAPYGGDE